MRLRAARRRPFRGVAGHWRSAYDAGARTREQAGSTRTRTQEACRSIDTEGPELDILAAFDFAAWDVRAISVEHNYTPLRDDLHALLTRVGYRRKWSEFSQWDDWYVKA